MSRHWVFGYGSLMWRPGFDFEERVQAHIFGFHRSLCVYSHVHRGTPERPGLVLGLDTLGSCHGIAYGVSEAKWDTTIAYLRAREQVTSVYLEERHPIHIGSETVEAVTYVVDRAHRQYAGRLPLDEQRRFMLQGEGVSGHCVDYVRATVDHLRELGIHDAALEELVA